MKNSKKSVVQLVKVFKQLNGEFNKTNNDSSVKSVDNCFAQAINLFRIQIGKFGSKIGSLAKILLIKSHLNLDIAKVLYNAIFLKC